MPSSAFLNSLISDTNCKLLDTRKTIPLNRIIQKWAVKIGGGENHRFGLYDMIMIKDNHIDFAGGISISPKNRVHANFEKPGPQKSSPARNSAYFPARKPP